MEKEPRTGYEATAASLSFIKPFYDRVFPKWEAIQIDPDNPGEGRIMYSATSEYFPFTEIKTSENDGALEKTKSIAHTGFFVVDDIRAACGRVETEEESGGKGEVIAAEDWENNSWCFCKDPAGNFFTIVQFHDLQT